MLQPKKTKFRKYHRSKWNLKNNTKTFVSKECTNVNNFYLQVSSDGCLKHKQLEAARRVINRKLKKAGRIRILPFPHLPITKKGLNTRMGTGKPSVDSWVIPIKKNSVVFEIYSSNEPLVLMALRSASFKLPLGCWIVKKTN